MAASDFDADVYETLPSESCDFYDLACVGGWIQDQISSFFLWAFERLMDGLAAVIEMIPVPDFLSAAGSFSIPGSVAWFANAFALDHGAQIIVAAYLLRFLIRRLPFIG